MLLVRLYVYYYCNKAFKIVGKLKLYKAYYIDK